MLLNWYGEEQNCPEKNFVKWKKMSEEHKMTKQDKLVLTITLAAIFLGIFVLGLVGLIVNLLS